MRKSRGMIKSLIRLHTSDYCQDGRRIVIHVALHPIMAVPSCHAQAKHRVSRIRQYLCFHRIGNFTWFMHSSCVCQFQSIYPPINGAEHVERGPEGCETSVRERTCPPVRPSVCVCFCVWVCGNSTFASAMPPPHDASTFVFSCSSVSGISICLTKQNDGAQSGGVVVVAVVYGAWFDRRSLLNSTFRFMRRFQNRRSFVRLPSLLIPASFVTPLLHSSHPRSAVSTHHPHPPLYPRSSHHSPFKTSIR